MPLTLIDDGTLDTVFSCSECGEEIRYSPEWREEWDYPGGEEVMIEGATEEHAEECCGQKECHGSCSEDLVTCQVKIPRADYEAAREYLEAGHPGQPLVGVKKIIRHPNEEEDGPFLRWLRASAQGERQPDLVEWFMNLVSGEQTVAELRQCYEDGEFEEEEIES